MMDWKDLAGGVAALLGASSIVGAAAWAFARRSFSSERLSHDVPALEQRLRAHEDECHRRNQDISGALHRLELQLAGIGVTLGDVKEDVVGLRKWRHELNNSLQQQYSERGLRREGIIPACRDSGT